MLKTINISIFALLSLSAFANYDTYKNSGTHNNGRFIICHTKDGFKYQIDTTFFPENVVINGMSLSFYRAIKSDYGYRHYEYLDDLGGNFAVLAIGDEKKFLLISRKKASCDFVLERGTITGES
ncbi:hypothetical protein ACOY5X_12605 [Enterobacter kobei]|uniref:hypothetical protein n=1 Tax=Enterobacter kobei TaxID=208224 RepID=UPI003BEEE437